MRNIKLSNADKVLLFNLMRKSTDYRLRKRAHAILLKSKKYDESLIADLFEIDVKEVKFWITSWIKFKHNGLYTMKSATLKQYA